MDGATDKSNIKDELFLVLWCDVDGGDERTHTHELLCSGQARGCNSSGSFKSLQNGLGQLGIKAIDAEECKKLVGLGTDEAAVNISALKGKVQDCIPWVYWTWCLAHGLELAI